MRQKNANICSDPLTERCEEMSARDKQECGSEKLLSISI